MQWCHQGGRYSFLKVSHYQFYFFNSAFLNLGSGVPLSGIFWCVPCSQLIWFNQSVNEQTLNEVGLVGIEGKKHHNVQHDATPGCELKNTTLILWAMCCACTILTCKFMQIHEWYISPSLICQVQHFNNASISQKPKLSHIIFIIYNAFILLLHKRWWKNHAAEYLFSLECPLRHMAMKILDQLINYLTKRKEILTLFLPSMQWRSMSWMASGTITILNSKYHSQLCKS